jgi:RNA recognition motif-containing protein
MGRRLYVGNLSYQTTEEQLAQFFGQDGRRVESVRLMTDRDTGQPRGFAFVEMSTDVEAREAIAAFDGADLDGRRLRVDEAQERQPREGGGGFGGRRSSGGGGGGGGRERGRQESGW